MILTLTILRTVKTADEEHRFVLLLSGDDIRRHITASSLFGLREHLSLLPEIDWEEVERELRRTGQSVGTFPMDRNLALNILPT